MPDQPNDDTIHYFGDYELLEEIASGGMGVVYKARQVSLNRVVALKMILAGQLATPEEVKRFQREARAVANCDHPGIVPIYEVGEHAGRHYFTMKLIAGNNLAHDLPHFRTHLLAAAHMLAQVARAVQHAHERGLLHRDLKPANILLDAGKRPHVTDFGLATKFTDGATLSRTGHIVGTASYMSPEQAAAQHGQLSPATDIYSLGAVLYEILMGRAPFRGTTVLDTLRQVVEHELIRPRTVNPALHLDLETICLKCMDRRPQRRYATAAALAEDLENWVAGRPIKARPVSRAERAWLWCRRQPRTVGLTAAAAVLALLVGLGLATVNYLKGKHAGDIADAATHQAKAADARAIDAAAKAIEADAQARAAKKAQEAIENTARYEKDMRKAGGFAQDQDYAALRQLLECWQPLPKGQDYRQWEWHYLRAVAARTSLITPQKADLHSPDEWYFTLPSGGKGVIRMHWSPDGRRLAVYDDAGWLRVLELASGKQSFAQQIDSPANKQLGGLASRVQQRLDAWSPDGKRLALSAPGGAVKILDAATGKPLAELPPMRAGLPGYWSNRSGYRAIAWSPDGLRIAASNSDPQVPIYDSSTGKELLSLPGHAGAVLTVAWSADGAKLASGGVDGKIKVWDVRDRRLAYTLAEDAPVMALAWRPDGGRLVASRAAVNAQFGKGSTLWDTEKRQAVWSVPAMVSPRESVWSSDGTRLALMRPNGYHLKANELFNAASGSVLYRGEMTGPPLSMDGELRRAARQVDYPGPCIVDLPNGKLERILVPWLSEVMGWSAWSPDGNTLAVAGTGGSLHIHHLPRENKHNRTLAVPYEKRIAWDLDSRHFTIRQTWKVALPLERADQEAVLRREPLLHQFGGLVFSPDGKRLAAVLVNNEIQLWDAASSKRTLRLAGHQRLVSQPVAGITLLWSPHGKYLASYRLADGTLKVWDVSTGVERFGIDLGGWPLFVTKMGWAWSPDDTQLAVSAATTPVTNGALRGETSVWDVATGLRKRSLATGVFDRLAWSPDGRLLACAREFGMGVQFWDATTGKMVDELTDTARGAPQSVSCLAWDPESRRVAWATSQFPHGGAVYDLKSQKFVPIKLNGGLTQIVWKPDGKQLAMTNGMGTMLFDTENGTQISDFTGGSLAWTPDALVVVRSRFPHNPDVIEIKNITSGATLVVQSPTDPSPPPVPPKLPANDRELAGVGWGFWSPDRKHFAVVRGNYNDFLRGDQKSSNQAFVVYDAAGKPEHKFIGDALQFNVILKDAAAWSPDSKFLAGGGTAVRVWDVAARKEAYCLTGHEGVVESSAWSPDGRRIVTTSRGKGINRDNCELKVWDAAAGREILHMRGLVAELVFNPDLTACSFLMATSLNDTSLVLWDLTGGAGLAGD